MTYLHNDPLKAAFDTLEEFADVISDKLQCPITIEDANHRLLAYSTHDERTDPARISTIIGRRVPEKVINSLWREGVIPALLNGPEPVRVKTLDEIGLGDRVAVSIWNKGEVLGFIWTLEIDRVLTEQDLLFLKRAADAVKSKLLQLQARKSKKEARSQEFFWKLLTGHTAEHEEIVENFQLLQISPAASFAVTVLEFEEDITGEEERQITYLLQTGQHLKTLLHTIDHRQLILLVSLHQVEQPLAELQRFVESFVGKMEKRFGVSAIRPACSGIHERYEKVKQAYQEALTVLSIKEKFPQETAKLYCYASMGMYQLIDIVLQARKGTAYENRALQELHAYDAKHHSNLAETLEVFLNKDSSVNDAAKALNVHVNTLKYRLQRITEIGGINLRDPNEKLLLYLDLKLEKFL
ncbi:PucR family transcriptional regulator [Ectobacillus ponti]|uniref:Helix-turn-helix domain-containing protein n=1 Tax=Ectobacillus ponti TaxID=2961894 RepID=A0AA42BT79_9BACI|nr:helix-turn-helix domain-containing protein [Ectobacillus ponti]MCP8971319.1 helix-turn-helix domain-containing protein [Ectobacillus ponti]